MDKNNLFFVVLTVHLIKGSFCNGNQQFPLDLISGMSQLVKENDIIPVARSGVFIDLIIKNQFKKLLSNLNYYSNQSSLNSVIPDLSPECDKKVVQFIKAFQQRQAWALNIIDSFGKPPSGISQGAVLWNGDYNECLDSLNKSIDYYSKYCKLAYPNQQIDITKPPGLRVGVCMPTDCDERDIAFIISFILSKIPMEVFSFLPINSPEINSSYVNCYSDTEELDASAKASIAVISFLIFLIIIGTFYDFYKLVYKYYKQNMRLRGLKRDANKATETSQNEIREFNSTKPDFKIEQNENFLMKIFLSFSVYSNLKKIFRINKSNQHLKCLHAIRFLSMSWVILGHTFVLGIAFSDNPNVLQAWLKRFTFMIITNAFFSVDSFFLLSGLLTSYIFMKELEKQKNIITIRLMTKFYIHRLWRITPAYMLVIMFSGCLTKYLGKGPNFEKDGFEPMCKVNWWTNLLYINNLVHTDKMCLGISWYLSNDMQFHFVSPVMLIPFAYGKKYIGLSIGFLLVCGHVLATALIINYNPRLEKGPLIGGIEYFENIYITPWCRAGPFFIGLILGYYIFKKENKEGFKMNTFIHILGLIMSLGLLGLMLFGIYPDYNGNPLTRIEHILYDSTNKIIWSLSLSFIIFSCIIHKGFLNKILSWSVWVPFSRLSFSAYLIHSNVIYYFYQSQMHNIYFQDINTVYIYIGNLVLSYCAALFISLTFEIPFLELEKFIMKKYF